jgi:tRNA/rRNA methyltransferase
MAKIGYMLSVQAREQLVVVLVGARNPGNIGAAARAMRDFGFSILRVVNEFAPPFEAAKIDGGTAAVAARAVLDAARRFDRLEDAIADCRLVAGTTAIGERGLSRPVQTLQEASPLLSRALVEGTGEDSSTVSRVALLFGSEKTGLTNKQLSHCSILLTIPMFAPEGERHLSMNLGQAVAVCLYELVRTGFEGERELPPLQWPNVSAETRERQTKLLLEAMEATGYARRFPANSREHVVRQLVQGLGATADEATTWMGFLRQVIRGEKQQ